MNCYEHARLGGRGDFVVQRLDPRPNLRQGEGIAGKKIGADDGFDVVAFRHCQNNVQAGMVDDVVGCRRRCDFTTQLMVGYILGIGAAQNFGEIKADVAVQSRIVWQGGIKYFLIEPQFGIGQKHRKFGAS